MTDYIPREAAMNVCERSPITQAIKGGEKSICWSCFHWDVCFAKENQPCIKCSRYIPSADVRPVVRGKWAKELHPNVRYSQYKCSICGEFSGHDSEGWIWKPRFCPNCGARMEES